MPNIFLKISDWLNGHKKLSEIISSIVLTLSVGIFVFLGLDALFLSFGSLYEQQPVEAAKAYLDFSWQLIQFTFVLAALSLAVDTRSRTSFVPKTLAFAFILSGVLLLSGHGLAYAGVIQKSFAMGTTGGSLIAVAFVPLAWGISRLLIESLNRCF